jgi:hypothetical protein
MNAVGVLTLLITDLFVLNPNIKIMKSTIKGKAPRGFILWEGLSPLDGSPIVCIATMKSVNRKTGNMIQTFILRQDVNPVTALKSGDDLSICGNCYHRGSNNTVTPRRKRSCYVNVGQAPNAVWNTYIRNVYPKYNANVHSKYFKTRRIRWGTYGDGAMLPAELVTYFNDLCISHTGYTHQWREPFAQWCKGVFMASCDGLQDYIEASSHSWKTFAVVAKNSVAFSGKQCPATVDNSQAQCITCNLCDGTKTDIFVEVHGTGASNFVAAV